MFRSSDINNILLFILLPDTNDKKAKEQQTSVLSVMKPKYEPFGVLLSKTTHTSDKAFGVRY